MKYQGLSQVEAERALKQYGYNEIQDMLTVSPIKIFLRQIKSNYIIFLLLFAMGLSFYIEKTVTAYTILAVIFIVVIVGFIMEYKAETAIKSLKKMITQMSTVIRYSTEHSIPSREIVPGDIIILRTGDKIPADCVILEAKELRVNESTLTGESKEISKTAAPNEHNYEQSHQLFMGTFIVNGRASAKVLHTGMNTEFGKIANMISGAEKEITLQNKINKIVKVMAINAVIFALVTGTLMIVKNSPITSDVLADILIVIIALSVSAFPEGYPVVLVTTLAAGARSMAAKNAIVNRMSIIETLGETTIVCTDKTGTLTKGEMTVKKICSEDRIIDVSGTGYELTGDFFEGKKKVPVQTNSHINFMLKAAVLCNDARIEKSEEGYKTYGSPTEIALLILAGKAGVFKDDIQCERMEEIPFNSHTKIMSVLVEERGKHEVYAKGAPEILLNKCSFYRKGNKNIKLTAKIRKKIIAQNKKLTAASLRSLGLAYKPSDKHPLDHNLIFLGLVAMEDPPRTEAKDAIHLCQKSGIAVKMLTGDNKDTATAIAKEVGLEGKVVEGIDLDHFSDKELCQKVKEITIFARVRPEHKLRIVRALKENGEIVSMTGDGVNDAPALKEAHIGIAMGKTGTDVSREVADLVLKDDNFATIVHAVTEGRTIFKNIQKVSVYQISITLAQLFFIFISILFNMPLPLIALQILFINILSDELTAIMLGFNPPSFDVMEVKPRKSSSLIDKSLLIIMLFTTLIMTILAVATYVTMLYVFNVPVDIARTTAFVTIVLFGILNAFTFRSFRYPVFKLPFAANKYIVYAGMISLIFTLIIVYTDLNSIFSVIPIEWTYWLIAGSIALLAVTIFDVIKVLNRKYEFIEVH